MKKTLTELQAVIEQGEGYYSEFKRTVNTDLKKEMVAFANASGGNIYIGIDDDGTLVNLQISNALYSKIQSSDYDCDPAIDIAIHKINDSVLQVKVKEGANKPYRCSTGFYIRNGANAQKMTTDAIVNFIEKEGHLRFDEQVSTEIDFSRYFSTSKW